MTSSKKSNRRTRGKSSGSATSQIGRAPGAPPRGEASAQRHPDVQDPHAALRHSLDAAGVQPIKLGNKLFYALNPEGVRNALTAAPIRPNPARVAAARIERAVDTEVAARIRQALEGAGFRGVGEPYRYGGHLLITILDDPAAAERPLQSFEEFAGALYATALNKSPTHRVSSEALLRIADQLDRSRFNRPLDYLGKPDREQVATYNQRAGADKTLMLTTWRKLASHHKYQAAMRKTLSRTAENFRRVSSDRGPAIRWPRT